MRSSARNSGQPKSALPLQTGFNAAYAPEQCTARQAQANGEIDILIRTETTVRGLPHTPGFGPKLRLPHIVVLAASLKQNLVFALLREEPLIDDQDLISPSNRRESVRDDDNRLVFDQPVDGF